MSILFANRIVTLLLILALGSWLGRFSARGISLGSAAVFFIAILFGHLGYSAPAELTELGLLLFVYSVGLQAGPRFFRTFRRQGRQFAVIGLATVATGALTTVGVAIALGLPYDLAAGLFTGALTNTPALAAAIEAVTRVAPAKAVSVSVAYGIGYPFSMIGVVLLTQFLPRILRRDVAEAETEWRQSQDASVSTLQAKQFRIANADCDGKRLAEVNPSRRIRANISRLRRGERVLAATPEVKIALGDIVTVVGPADEVEKMGLLLGAEVQAPLEVNTDVTSVEVEVTEKSLLGKQLGDLRLPDRFNVVVTRIRRQGLELTPTGASTLELGDTIRVVGVSPAVRDFIALAGREHRRADETNMVTYTLGLALGAGIGAIPFPLGAGVAVRLGGAAGALVIGLLIGHFGRIGPFRLYVPPAARNLSRELGLMLFLAGAGATAGSRLVSVFQERGLELLLGGMVITTVTVLAGLLLMMGVYRLNILSAMGALSACMTNPPALNVANERTETDLPMLAYASAYPVALIAKIVIAQPLVEVLRAVAR